MPGIVTPEAVRLEFQEAGVGSRGAAFLLDALIVGTVLVALSIGAAAVADLVSVPGWVGFSTYLVLVLLVVFGYPIVGEVAFGGRTLGKAALGLRVVTVEGAPVRLRHAAIRSAFLLVDVLATGGAGAVISALLTRRSQRLGDLAAGTVVLRERQASGPAAAVAFRPPPGAEAYTNAIPAGVLDRERYRRVRAFLLRAPQLEPEARERLAAEIARPLLSVAPEPPQGMDPVTFLTAVAAAYQRGAAGRRPAPAGRSRPRAADADDSGRPPDDHAGSTTPASGRSTGGGFSAPG